MNTEKMNEFEQLKQKIVAKEISVSILEAREYKNITYWYYADGLCELTLDCGSACGSEELLRDMIDTDKEVA